MTSRFQRVTAVESSAPLLRILMHNVPKGEAASGRRWMNTCRLRPKLPTSCSRTRRARDLEKHAIRHLVRAEAEANSHRRVRSGNVWPATWLRCLRRDMQLDKMILVDLFPQTYHMETIVRLSL